VAGHEHVNAASCGPMLTDVMRLCFPFITKDNIGARISLE